MSELKRVVTSIEAQIATLKAYRKSLIHECVTGQRRITGSDLRQVGAATDLLSAATLEGASKS